MKRKHWQRNRWRGADLKDKKVIKIKPYNRKKRITCHGKSLADWPFIKLITKEAMKQDQKTNY